MPIRGRKHCMARRKKSDELDIPPPPDERIIFRHANQELDRETVHKLTIGIVDPKKQKFLCYLAILGNRTRAAQAVPIACSATWFWKRDDEQFRARYDDAMKMAAELHENEMFRRASEGVLEPVYQGGKMAGVVRKYSDTLLIFALKGAMPEKYADRQKVEHSGQVDVVQRLRAARERALGRKS